MENIFVFRSKKFGNLVLAKSVNTAILCHANEAEEDEKQNYVSQWKSFKGQGIDGEFFFLTNEIPENL